MQCFGIWLVVLLLCVMLYNVCQLPHVTLAKQKFRVTAEKGREKHAVSWHLACCMALCVMLYNVCQLPHATLSKHALSGAAEETREKHVVSWHLACGSGAIY